MGHSIHRVTSVDILDGYRLRVGFDDGIRREIDFEPILEGELYGPLRARSQFERVRLDPQAHTLVWPNGADFDPAILHDWPRHEEAMKQLARRWSLAKA